MIIVELEESEERNAVREEGGRRRGAPGFGLGIVVMGVREVCGAVETVGSGCRDIVTCRGQRGEVCVPGVSFVKRTVFRVVYHQCVIRPRWLLYNSVPRRAADAPWPPFGFAVRYGRARYAVAVFDS